MVTSENDDAPREDGARSESQSAESVADGIRLARHLLHCEAIELDEWDIRCALELIGDEPLPPLVACGRAPSPSRHVGESPRWRRIDVADHATRLVGDRISSRSPWRRMMRRESDRARSLYLAERTKALDDTSTKAIEIAKQLRESREKKALSPTPPPAAVHEANLVRMADVAPEPVEWLWPGRIACGKLTLIAGDPGLGKSFLSIDLAARVSKGAGWPDELLVAPRRTPGSVILLSAEDDPGDTIRPRLDSAGADCTKVHLLHTVADTRDPRKPYLARLFDLGLDIMALDAAIKRIGDCRLVVVDPISAYLGKVDGHANSEVRALLAPLAQLASHHRLAVVAVTHLNKGAGSAIYRTMGSLAFAAAARAVWGVVRDRADEDVRLFVPIKNNIGRDRGVGLTYKVEAPKAGGGPGVTWLGPTDITADEALAPQVPGAAGSKLGEAKDWLRDYLADGPKLATEVAEQAEERGIKTKTLNRAKEALGIDPQRTAEGRWIWGLPKMANT